MLGYHGVQVVPRPGDRIYRASVDASRTADAVLLDDAGYPFRGRGNSCRLSDSAE